MDFVSFVWAFVMGITDLQIFYMWSAVSCILFTIWLIQKSFDPEREIKGPNSYGWEQRGKIWNLWTYLLVTVLTTLYLPTITASFKVLYCFETLMAPYELTCFYGLHWLHFGVALFVFLYIGLYLPYQIYLTINKYQPPPYNYDELGDRYDKEFDRDRILKSYREILAKDTCPYNFLYCGYEYGWSAYKVITMIIKMILIIPLIPFFTSSVAAASFSLVVVSLYALTSAISTPFILPQDDWIDLSARITAVLTLVLQICILKEVITPPYDGYFLTILNLGNLIIMVTIFIGSLGIVRNFFKKHFGRLEFSPGMVYNIPIERRKRIWQRFWKQLFSSYGTLLPCANRLDYMESVFSKYGKQVYKDSLIPPTMEIGQARRTCLEIEGNDAYYRKEGVNKKTTWGRMFITPFPFTVNIVFDDNVLYEIRNDNEIITFVQQNVEKNVLQAKRIRKSLRCLDGEIVKYPLDVIIPYKKRCRTEDINVHFETGILKIKKAANDPFVQGFKVYIYYEDGEGFLQSGEMVKDIKYKAKGLELGITDSYQPTQELNTLLELNKDIIASKSKELKERIDFMHDDIEEFRQEEDAILSYNFWQLVYMNDHCPKDELVLYLKEFEQNPEIHVIPSLYADDLNGLYARLHYYDTHPAISIWFCFFDDVYYYNSIISSIANKPELFDLSNPSALAYHPMQISQLKSLLEGEGLRTSKGGGLFNDKIMDKFESMIMEECSSDYIPTKVSYVPPMSTALATDTRCSSSQFITENTTLIATAAMALF